MWTCPECRRRFGRTRQGHDCAPAMTLDEYFGPPDAPVGPAFERPVWDAVEAHLDTIDGEPTYVEPVSVGLFCKHGSRTFLQLRPMTKWVAVSFTLARRVESKRMARKVIGQGGSWYHVINVRVADEVDDQLCQWITEAYWAAD